VHCAITYPHEVLAVESSECMMRLLTGSFAEPRVHLQDLRLRHEPPDGLHQQPCVHQQHRHRQLHAARAAVRAGCASSKPPSYLLQLWTYKRLLSALMLATWTRAGYAQAVRISSTCAGLSPAADVYSFGIIMFEIYAGQMAFHGANLGHLIFQIGESTDHGCCCFLFSSCPIDHQMQK
jgi:hypothetical protein